MCMGGGGGTGGGREKELCSVQRCFTSTETVRTISVTDGEPRTSTSTFTQLLTSLSLLLLCCLMSSDVGWHIRDKLRPMPKHGSI